MKTAVGALLLQLTNFYEPYFRLIETYFNKLATTIGEDKKPGSSLGEDFPKPLDLLKWLDLVPPDDGPTLVECHVISIRRYLDLRTRISTNA
jgi:hypothetical protein